MKSANQLALSVVGDLARQPRGNRSLVAHLTEAMRHAILAGRLAGTLPSTRALATATGLGRSSWVEVIEQLALEGYLQTHQGAATRVTPLRPQATTTKQRATAEPVVSHRWIQDDPPSPVVHRAFRVGLPDLRSFPNKEWANLVARRCRQPISHDLSYAHPNGLPALREALLVHLRQTRGVVAEPEQVLVVPSAQAAFAILCDACLKTGDVAWVEDPGYPGIRSVLRSRGANVVARPVDAQGMTLDASAQPAPRLIYTTPSHQYPTGITMPLVRRLELLEHAACVDALVVEDDYDSEYQYHGKPLQSLQGLDTQGCVAYVGTFSKTLAPGLRMAYLVAPQRWAALMETVATVSGYGVPVHLQLAMADFLSGGGFQKHLRRVTTEAGERLQLLARTLNAANEPRLEVPLPLGGLQLCMGWKGKTPDIQLVQALSSAGIAALPLSALCQGNSRQGLVLGVGLVPAPQVVPAGQSLLDTLRHRP